jgi:hypothetical protein
VSTQTAWAEQEREARTANEMAAARATRGGREVDRILWNHGRETVDEIVVHNCTIHLEQMTGQSYWMGISKGGADFTVNLSHRGRLPLQCTGYDNSGYGGIEWNWDDDDEHIGGPA